MTPHSPHSDDDLLKLIAEVHGTTPRAAEEASLARAVDTTEKTGRRAAQALKELTYGRVSHNLTTTDRVAGRLEPEPVVAAPNNRQKPIEALPESREVTRLYQTQLAPVPGPERRELTRQVRLVPGGHVESGSGRQLPSAPREAKTFHPVPNQKETDETDETE